MSDQQQQDGAAQSGDGAQNAQNQSEDASPISGTAPPKDTRWRKGTSGNPGGRPKGKSVTHYIREIGEREHNGKTLLEHVVERIYKDALSGKFPAIKEIVERLDGKVTDKHELESKGGGYTMLTILPPRVIGEPEADYQVRLERERQAREQAVKEVGRLGARPAASVRARREPLEPCLPRHPGEGVRAPAGGHAGGEMWR